MVRRCGWRTALLASVLFFSAKGQACQGAETTSLLQLQQEEQKEQKFSQQDLKDQFGQEEQEEEEREVEDLSCTKVPEHTCMSTAGPYPFKGHAPYDESGIEGKQDHLEAADCPLCRNGGWHSALLFGSERYDGMGERGAGIIKLLAMASYAKMNVGGLLPSGNEESHNVDMPKGLSKLLGADYAKMLVTKEKPQFDHCFYSDEQIFLDATRNPPWSNGDAVLFATCRTGPVFSDVLLTEEFRKRLRESSPLMTQSVQHFAGTLKQGGKLTVAMHVRRGDLTTGEWRAVPDEMNYRIIEGIQSVFDNTDFHVFSSTEGKHTSSEFDGYRDRGVTVHLDGEIDEDWAHMAQADLLLLAQSTFGWVPAVLTDKCVVAFSSFHHLDHWIVHHNGEMSGEVLKQIKNCVAEKHLPN